MQKSREIGIFFVSFIFVDYIPASFIVLRIYVALVIHVFLSICDLEAGDNHVVVKFLLAEQKARDSIPNLTTTISEITPSLFQSAW